MATKKATKSRKRAAPKKRRSKQAQLSNLSVRLLTAAVVIPVLLALLFLVPWWGFFALVVAATGVAAYELVTMTMADLRWQQGLGVAASLGVLALFYFATSSAALMSGTLAVVLFGFFVALAFPDPMPTAGARMAWLVAAPFYCGGLLSTIALLHRLPNGGAWVLLAMAVAWLGDTGGYFAGRAFGKHKLYPKVSPKKTVEGAAGGLLASMAGAVILHFVLLDELPLLHALLLAAVAGAAGQAGDLTVSLVKRSVGAKDSGTIVPGHGGILDRIDGLMMTSAVTWAYTVWFL